MRTILSALPLALATLVGCAVSPGDPNADGVADAEAGSTATAIVVVERTVSGSSGLGANGGIGGENVRAEAVARFVRMRSGAVDDDALRMVGAATDFPAIGSCSQLSAFAGSGSSAPARAIALVDVGTITIESAGQKTTLSPRQLPDVADIVSGVVYTARPGDAALPARVAYLLRAGGAGSASESSSVAPFTVSAIAPAEPSEIRIAGQDVRASNGLALATVAPSAPVEITWEPGESGATDDVIYIDISGSAATSGAAVVTVPTTRCLFADVGHASLPANVLGAIDDGTVSIHRLHREAIHARGVDPGEMRFDFARVVAISRR